MAVFHCDSVIGDESFLFQHVYFLFPFKVGLLEGEKKKKKGPSPPPRTSNLLWPPRVVKVGAQPLTPKPLAADSTCERIWARALPGEIEI